MVMARVFQFSCCKKSYYFDFSAEDYTDVRSDFNAKIPGIYFKPLKEDLLCQLSVSNTMAQHTTRLLQAYSAIDPRVKKLGVIFRYWAKVPRS